MTKNQDLQKEILAIVTPGIKPSDLKKKLKKSKSLDDITQIPTAPPLPNNQAEINHLKQEFNSQLQAINCLFDPNAINYTQPINFNGLYQHLKTLLTNSPPQPLLLDQLKEKQTELENLRKQLEESLEQTSQTNAKLTETTAELDNSLESRHQSLKDWEKQQAIIKKLNEELEETIDQASEEIIAGDDEISQLKSKVYQLKSAKENLARDLKLAQRLAEIRKVPLPDNSANLNYLKYALYSLGTVWLLLFLTNSEKENLWTKKL